MMSTMRTDCQLERSGMNNIDFQPVPKRFMVWDKETKAFWYDFGGQNLIFESEIRLGLWLANRKEVHGLDLNRFIIIQSTNLFDKDSNEIFEGSIVEDRCSGLNWLVFIENGEVFIRHRGAVMHYGYISTGTKKWVETNVKRIGHILSNPELMEKEDV